MSWFVAFLFVSAAISNVSFTSASFLSTIDEFRRIDNVNKAHKRLGPITGMEPPMPGDDDVGEQPSYGADEEGDLDCDAIMAQCQCEEEGGSYTGGGGDVEPVYPEVQPAPPVQPVPQNQQRSFGFDDNISDYPDRSSVDSRRWG